MHPWDDLEQRFLNYSITLKELVKAISAIADDPKVPAEVVDSVANTVNGMLEYIQINENLIADGMEAKIVHDYKSGKYQQTHFITEIGENGTITLPKVVCNVLKWRVGDTLQWELRDDNTVVVRKLGR